MIGTTRFRTLSLVLAAALLIWIAWQARELKRAIDLRDRARVTVAAASPRASLGAAFGAPDEATARAHLTAWIGDRAAATSVRLSLASIAAAEPDQIRMKLVARADELALRRFLRAIEAPGLVRAGSWKLAADGAAGATLAAEIAANWRSDLKALPILPAPPPETGRLLLSGTVTDIAPSSGDAPELIGIAGRLPDDALAMLRLSDGTTRSVARGAKADGWRLTAIAADRVTLTKNGRTRVAVLPASSS